MTDLEAFTLNDVNAHQQAIEDLSQLMNSNVPLIITTARENVLATVGGIPPGKLVWNQDESELRYWDGTDWKTIAIVQ